MAKQRSQQERKIFSVTGSTSTSERGWSELVRKRQSAQSLERGTAEGMNRDLWDSEAIEEPIAPETER
ncbi:MAG TPA: hypothetical protein VGD74_08255 [Vulgatibacter sp.]